MVFSRKSEKYEMCGSLHIRFPCAYIADVRRFATAVSSENNAALSR